MPSMVWLMMVHAWCLFAGTEAMGLFWSMKQTPGQAAGRRLVKKDVTTPLVFDLTLISGHVTESALFGERSRSDGVLASGRCQRSYMADGVQRRPLVHPRLKGTFFIPEGKLTAHPNGL